MIWLFFVSVNKNIYLKKKKVKLFTLREICSMHTQTQVMNDSKL